MTDAHKHKYLHAIIANAQLSHRYADMSINERWHPRREFIVVFILIVRDDGVHAQQQNKA